MKIEVYNQKGEVIEEVNLSQEIFGLNFNKDLVYQVYTSLLSNQKKPIAFTKDRSEVRGGGKKPWAQREQEEQGMVLSDLLFGREVVFLSDLGKKKKIGRRKLIRK